MLHVTPCNAAPGTSYETDPRAGPWPWTSPDVTLDGDSVRIRVTNRGDAASGPLTIGLDAQGTTDAVPLRAAQWRPVGEAALPPIGPGVSAEVRIPWQAPRVPAAATGWGLRAIVIDEQGGGQHLVVLSSIGTLNRPTRFDAVL